MEKTYATTRRLLSTTENYDLVQADSGNLEETYRLMEEGIRDADT